MVSSDVVSEAGYFDSVRVAEMARKFSVGTNALQQFIAPLNGYIQLHGLVRCRLPRDIRVCTILERIMLENGDAKSPQPLP